MLVENVCLTPPPPSRQGRNAGVFQHIPSLRVGTSGGGSVETVHAPSLRDMKSNPYMLFISRAYNHFRSNRIVFFQRPISALQKTVFFFKDPFQHCRKPFFFSRTHFCNAGNPFFSQETISAKIFYAF
jgi:hypothetical protein